MVTRKGIRIAMKLLLQLQSAAGQCLAVNTLMFVEQNRAVGQSEFLMDVPLIYQKSFFCTFIILECLSHSRMSVKVTWNKFLSFYFGLPQSTI